MGFFFTLSHFISQFPSTRFPLLTAIRMGHFLPVASPWMVFWAGSNGQNITSSAMYILFARVYSTMTPSYIYIYIYIYILFSPLNMAAIFLKVLCSFPANSSFFSFVKLFFSVNSLPSYYSTYSFYKIYMIHHFLCHFIIHYPIDASIYASNVLGKNTSSSWSYSTQKLND